MNILITSLGRRNHIITYFMEAFKGKGKVYASNSEFTIALKKANDYFITPLIYEENYIDTLISFCKKKDIKAIISVFDIDLLVLAKNKELIEQNGIKLLLANEKVVEICNDKYKTYEFLKENGIGTPKTYNSLEKVQSAISENEMQFPIIIKPRWGMASLSIYKADDMEELIVFSKKAEKEIFNSHLKYESNITPDNVLIYQEILKGQEYGLDVINDLEGNFIGVFPKSKLRIRGGETDFGQTVNPNKFEKLAKKLSDLCKHQVILSVDCFEEEDEIKVIEMNCRISGHYPLSHLAGVNLPQQILEWLQGKPTDLENFNFETGLYVTKYLEVAILKED